MKSHRYEDYVQTLTTFTYKYFDQEHTDYRYDSTPEQICNEIWKEKNSVVFTKMTTFYLKEEEIRYIDIKTLQAIPNKYANGHDEDMNTRTLRIKKETEDFKNKHKIT